MKLNRFFTALFAAVACALSAGAQGIEFMPEGSLLKDAVAKAKAEGKMVFLDCYTSWCGPCRMMATKIFPTQEVGDFMNPKFVSIKIDMEKGEGSELGKNLQINAYPTFVIFNNDGSEAARFVGGGDVQGFIKRVNENLADDGPAALEARFKSGDRDRQFLLDYLSYLGKVYRRQQCDVVAGVLLEGNLETFAADTTLRKVFMNHVIDPLNPAFVYVAKNRATVEPVLGKDVYDNKIKTVLDRSARSMIDTDANGGVMLNQKKFDDYMALIKDCNIDKAEHYRLSTLMTYAERKQDWGTYMDLMESYLADKDLDMADMSVCSWASNIAYKCEDAQVRERMKKVAATRLDDIKSGRRAAQTFPENRQPRKMPVDILEELVKILDGEKPNL